MRTPHSVAATAYLLHYDRGRGRLRSTWLGYAVRAAALSDLWAAGGLIDDGGRARATNRRPPTDPVLRELWSEVSDAPVRWRTLIRRNRRRTENAVAAELEVGGTIRINRPARRFRRADIEMRDPLVLTRLEARVGALLRSADPFAPADAALIGVLAVADVRTAISKQRAREYADRIATAVAGGGPAVPALRHAIRQARSSMS